MEYGNIKKSADSVKLDDLLLSLHHEKQLNTSLELKINQFNEDFRKVLKIKNGEINQLVIDLQEKDKEIDRLKHENKSADLLLEAELKKQTESLNLLQNQISEFRHEISVYQNQLREKQQLIDALQIICKKPSDYEKDSSKLKVRDLDNGIHHRTEIPKIEPKVSIPHSSQQKVTLPHKVLGSNRKNVQSTNSSVADYTEPSAPQSNLKQNSSDSINIPRAISPGFQQYLNQKGTNFNHIQRPTSPNPFFTSSSRQGSRKSTQSVGFNSIQEENSSFLSKEVKESGKVLANLDAQINDLENLFDE